MAALCDSNPDALCAVSSSNSADRSPAHEDTAARQQRRQPRK